VVWRVCAGLELAVATGEHGALGTKMMKNSKIESQLIWMMVRAKTTATVN